MHTSADRGSSVALLQVGKMGASGSKRVNADSPKKPTLRGGQKSAAAQRVDKMTEAQLHEFRDAFNHFDKDGSGSIDQTELRSLCEWVGQETNDEEVKSMMYLADGDNSGKIDFWEFATLMAHKMGDAANPDKTLHAAFSVFDFDGSGTISAEEIREVMLEMGEPIEEGDISSVMGDIDSNGDGSVDYDEFAKVVTREMRDGGFALV